MKCHFCGGELKPGKTPYTINEPGFHVILDEVAALVCAQCHEPLFDEKTTEMLVSLGRHIVQELERCGAVV